MGRMLNAVVVAVVGVGGLVGCQQKQPPSTQPVFVPASADSAKALREEYQKRDQTVQVGLVIAVKGDSNLAAVGEVTVSAFKPGDVVTFIDSSQTVIAVGHVVNVVSDAVHVKYVPQGPGSRAPQEGDLAVKVG